MRQLKPCGRYTENTRIANINVPEITAQNDYISDTSLYRNNEYDHQVVYQNDIGKERQFLCKICINMLTPI
jgi:hypothetical protein